MLTLQKIAKLAKSYIQSQFEPLPLWVHLWVTDKCDLFCDYCEVVDREGKTKNPKKEDVETWIAHADDLGSTVIAFMGGEPTLRKDLADLIATANERNLITYVTTHGGLLTNDKLTEFGQAGLDCIEISLDGYHAVNGSEKTLKGNESLIDKLERTKKRYGIRYKAHQVLSPENLKETPKLIELAKRRNFPITFGLVTEFETFRGGRRTVYETPEVRDEIDRTLQTLMRKKREGAPIMTPLQYFRDARKFLDAPLRWDCDVGSYMIQVAPSGNVFVCSKLNKREHQQPFLNIDKTYFTADKHQSKALLEKCNANCFSACAYTTSYLRQHPLEAAYAVANGPIGLVMNGVKEDHSNRLYKKMISW